MAKSRQSKPFLMYSEVVLIPSCHHRLPAMDGTPARKRRGKVRLDIIAKILPPPTHFVAFGLQH